jgi:hypothetical protein
VNFSPVAFHLSHFSLRRALALVGPLTAWLLFGCATLGPPQPPRLERPEQVSDLKVLQVGHILEIRFTLPRYATDGERLRKPVEIQLLRLVTPPGPPPSGAPALTPWISLLPDQWPPYVYGERIVFPARLSDQELRQWQGSYLVVAVRTLTRGFRHHPLESDLSNLTRIPLLDVSGPVENLQPRTTEKAIELTWTPPARTLGGRPLSEQVGYRIYRSRTGKQGSFEPLSETSSATCLDPDFAFGRTYFYKVRAVFKQGGATAESEDSPGVEVTPRDVFPPAAPTGLTALYAAGAVELVWTANTEPDLAGYNVYRREAQEPARRMNEGLLRTPLLRDSTVEPGRSYTYWVTAVDLTGNESPPSPVASVETQ